jgi:ABC-type molybdate transport system permease subunit
VALRLTLVCIAVSVAALAVSEWLARRVHRTMNGIE